MKSFLAIFAGLVTTIVVTTAVDVIMHTTGFFPENGADMSTMHWSVATAYRLVFAVFGCWLAARLAPSKPMKHALITGGIGTAIAIAGAVFAWNKGAAFGPHWYAIGLVVTAMPCAWLGGKLSSTGRS